MRRGWVLLVLIALAVVGGVLIVTADDDATGPALEPVVTVEGLSTFVPAGWVAEGDLPWEYRPPGGLTGFELWSVARACPLAGCEPTSLEDWLATAADLPTFVEMRRAEGDTLFNLSEERLSDAYVARARTPTAAQVVFVAAFDDGADHYVACTARVPVDGDERLLDALVDVCRATEEPP